MIGDKTCKTHLSCRIIVILRDYVTRLFFPCQYLISRIRNFVTTHVCRTCCFLKIAIFIFNISERKKNTFLFYVKSMTIILLNRFRCYAITTTNFYCMLTMYRTIQSNDIISIFMFFASFMACLFYIRDNIVV